MNTTGIMVIGGNSIEELEKALETMKAMIGEQKKAPQPDKRDVRAEVKDILMQMMEDMM